MDATGNLTHLMRYYPTSGSTAEHLDQVAQYEYGPFGELRSMTGPQAPVNPIRWSTKFTDVETGLVYYGYRYYSPSMGRWISRDPINDENTYKLLQSYSTSLLHNTTAFMQNDYVFVGNSCNSSVDYIGLQTVCKTMCGPQVQKQLAATLRKVQRNWNASTRYNKIQSCLALVDVITRDPARGGFRTYLNAWDIRELHMQAWINTAPVSPPCALPNIPPSGNPAGCSGTVQVGSDCHYAGSVNYVLFGKVTKLCGYDRYKVAGLVQAYKGGIPGIRTAAGNFDASLRWTLAGYDGWSAGNQSPMGDRLKCSPKCSYKITTSDFAYYWAPNGWR